MSEFKDLEIVLTEFPSEEDWKEVKRRALITVGLEAVNSPDES